jgi:hypothetical protein
MHRYLHRCCHAVFAVVASLVIGTLLLSACGRSVQRAALDTAIPVLAPTASPPGAPAPFTLAGPIEQIAQERWVVAGTPVVLDAQTALAGTPAQGAMAHIQGAFTADGALLARSIVVDALAIAPTSTTTPTATPSPIPSPTATPLPPGTVVNINGPIEHISITNNVTIIVVNQITYVMPHNVVLLLGKQLRIGVPIVFVGQVDTAGQIVIINVIQINHQVIVINPPRHHDDEDEEGGDD